MGKIISAFLPLLFFFCIIFTQHSLAVTYKYIDKNGTSCFTDSIQAIPEEYRKKAFILDGKSEIPIGECSELSIAGEPDTQQVVVSRTEKVKRTIKDALNNRLLKAIALTICFLIIFFIAGKMGSTLKYKQTASIIRIILICLALFFFYTLYSKEVVHLFDKLTKEVTTTKKLLEEREKKTNAIQETEKPQK